MGERWGVGGMLWTPVHVFRHRHKHRHGLRLRHRHIHTHTHTHGFVTGETAILTARTPARELQTHAHEFVTPEAPIKTAIWTLCPRPTLYIWGG